MDRALTLALFKRTDKCWVSVSLLGVTCQECSRALFLMSYSSWFDKLLELLKMPSDSHFIKISCCAALSDLFMRLYCFPTYRKEGVSLSNKLIPSALELLTEDAADDMLESAVGLLCNLMNLFPSSFHRHYDNAETVLATMLSRSSAVSKMFAQLLAFLPRAKGDAVSWSQMITKALISINIHLNYVFEGFEDENKGMNIINLLVERGKEPPPPLGGSLEDGGRQAKQKFEKLHIPCACRLIQCCITMLTSPYHVQVSVPVQSLLALVERMLSLDGNDCYASTPVMAITQLEFLFSDLPMLHLSGLDLLDAIITGVRSQLLPATGKIVRLLQSYFQRFSLPSIRAKLYKISKALLMSMNAGMALYFASDIIDNASRDLNHGIQGRGFISFPMLSSKHVTEASNVTKKRKRKLASGGPEDNSNPLQAEVFSDQPNVPFSVLISALQAIEALLMVGGSLRSQSWRPDVDLLLMRVASRACEEGWSYVDSDIIMEDRSFSWADFQLAALKALLASLLSPCTHRPPYLSYGLALFRKGKQEAGTQIADFCAHALLALDSLIHPRSLQLISPPLGGNGDFSQRFDLLVNENRKSHVPFSQEQKSKFPGMNCPSMQKPDKRNLPIDAADIYPDDKLCMGWLADMEENDTDTLYNSEEVQVDCQTESTTFKLNTVEKTQCCLVVDAEGILKENTRNTSLIVVPQTQVAINATAADKSAVEELEGHGLQPPVHMKEGNSGETEGAESKGMEPLKPVSSPSKEAVVSAGVSDIVSEDLFFNRFSSYNSEEFAKQSSDSESLPDIVDGDPDSD
ncbi:uncharacterized protein LOC116257435 isoform X2 [Nymphaea colorata]|uniref:uncharacterized protein LOC116257435 isoform X2 n=1 Tax=Nymphaea colorata TaxID=210225 RepID=UPI00129E607F|nr:uncharacterized protein LOC116257435 isoform X2 [Nymphaea colorata]